MASTLTAAGIKICLALVSNDPLFQPTAEACEKMMWQAFPYQDRWSRAPVQRPSCPDSSTSEFCKPRGYECVAYAKYDIFDGTKGTSWICYREATLKFIPETLQWYWVMGGEK